MFLSLQKLRRRKSGDLAHVKCMKCNDQKVLVKDNNIEGKWREYLTNFEAWKGSSLVGNGRLLWRIIPFSILWSIWQEINDRIFNRKESSWEVLLASVTLRIAKWACVRKEFLDIKIDDIVQSWEPCLKMRVCQKKRKVFWHSPPTGTLKFNVDGVAKGNVGLAGIGGVIRNHKGEVKYIFSKHVGIKDSNEAKVLAILEAPRIYRSSYNQALIVESDSANAITWMKAFRGPWKIQFFIK